MKLKYIFIILALITASVTALGSFNPLDNRPVGIEFLDSSGKVVNAGQGSVVHIWNTKDDYFFDKESGVQFTNNFQEYWTHNVFCAGYKDAQNQWQYDCLDSLPFNWQIQTDDATYVNITGWRDKSVGDKTVRLAIRYHLKLNDANLSIQTSIENIGTSDINTDLGFAWRVKDIQIRGDEGNDKIRINNTVYNLSDNLDLTFTNLNDSSYELFDQNLLTKAFIKFGWDKNLNYALTIKSSEGIMNESIRQYNAPITLMINAGTLAVGQRKMTTFSWQDPVQFVIPFYDGFEDAQSWTYWTETTGTGWVQSTACPTTCAVGTRCACAESGATDILEMTNGVDLSGYSDCILTYYTLVDSSFDAGEAYNVAVSATGVTWTNIYSCTNGQACENTAWTLQTYNITAGIGLKSNFKVRVIAGGNDANEEAGFDEVLINCSYNAIYPTFSNYWSNNATLVDSGLGKFNVTVANTNGTVLLEINGVNVTAKNLTSNVYNASYSFTSGGTYPYRWHSWGNGSMKDYNVSSTQYYYVAFAPAISNVGINETTPFKGMYINHSATITGATDYIFSWSAGGAGCNTWVNSSRISLSGSSASNVSMIPLTCGGKTINYTFFAGNGISDYSSGIYSYTANQYGQLLVNMLTPTSETNLVQNKTMWVNATVTCYNGTCGNVNINARYNSSSTNPDTNIPLSGTPLMIQQTQFNIQDNRNQSSKIIITNNGAELTDYQKLLAISNKSGMSPDFSDVVFYDSAGNQLGCWKDEYNATSANFYINVDLPVGNTTIIQKWQNTSSIMPACTNWSSVMEFTNIISKTVTTGDANKVTVGLQASDPYNGKFVGVQKMYSGGYSTDTATVNITWYNDTTGDVMDSFVTVSVGTDVGGSAFDLIDGTNNLVVASTDTFSYINIRVFNYSGNSECSYDASFSNRCEYTDDIIYYNDSLIWYTCHYGSGANSYAYVGQITSACSNTWYRQLDYAGRDIGSTLIGDIFRNRVLHVDQSGDAPVSSRLLSSNLSNGGANALYSTGLAEPTMKGLLIYDDVLIMLVNHAGASPYNATFERINLTTMTIISQHNISLNNDMGESSNWAQGNSFIPLTSNTFLYRYHNSSGSVFAKVFDKNLNELSTHLIQSAPNTWSYNKMDFKRGAFYTNTVTGSGVSQLYKFQIYQQASTEPTVTYDVAFNAPANSITSQLSYGQSINISWLVNATTSTSSSYKIDISTTSSYGNSNVPNNDTSDVLINLNPLSAQNTTFTVPIINETGLLFPAMYINHSVNISNSPTQYLFSWNASGASCDTWSNSSWISTSGSTIVVSNVSAIPSACADKIIGYRFCANNSAGQNCSAIQSYNISSYGTLSVDITAPENQQVITQYDLFNLNASVTCTGGAFAKCGNITGLARYNGSSANADTEINITLGGVPVYIQGTGTGGGGGGTSRPSGYSIINNVVNPTYSYDNSYNDTSTYALIDSEPDTESGEAFLYLNYTGISGSSGNISLTLQDGDIMQVVCLGFYWNYDINGWEFMPSPFDNFAFGTATNPTQYLIPVSTSDYHLSNDGKVAVQLYCFAGSSYYDQLKVYDSYFQADGGGSYTPDSNMRTSNYLILGDSFNVSWKINYTGAGDQKVDVKFNSSYGNSKVSDADTEDRLITHTEIVTGTRYNASASQSLSLSQALDRDSKNTKKLSQGVAVSNAGSLLKFLKKNLNVSMVMNSVASKGSKLKKLFTETLSVSNLVQRTMKIFKVQALVMVILGNMKSGFVMTKMFSIPLLFNAMARRTEGIFRVESDTFDLNESMIDTLGARRVNPAILVIGAGAQKTYEGFKNLANNLNINAIGARIEKLTRLQMLNIVMNNVQTELAKLSKRITQSIQVQGLTFKNGKISKTISQLISIDVNSNRIVQNFKKVTQTFTINNIAQRIYRTSEGLSQTFTINNIAYRKIFIFKSTSDNIFLNNIVSRTAFITKPFSAFITTADSATGTFSQAMRQYIENVYQTLGINNAVTRTEALFKKINQQFIISPTIKLKESIYRTTTQTLTINGVTSKISSLFDRIYQLISFQSSTSRIAKMIDKVNQQVSIGNSATRTAKMTDRIIQSFMINNVVSRIAYLTKSTSTSFSINDSAQGTYANIANVILRSVSDFFNVNNAVTRTEKGIRSITQALIAQPTIKLKESIFRIPAQSLTISSVTSKTFGTLRSPLQELTINNIIYKKVVTFRVATNNILFNNLVSRTHFMLKHFSVSFAYSDSATGSIFDVANVYLENVAQGLGINSAMSRAENLLRNPTILIPIDDILSRLARLFNSESQQISVSVNETDIYSGKRTVNQSINEDDIVSRFYKGKKIITNNIIISQSVSRVDNLFKNFANSISIQTVTIRLEKLSRGTLVNIVISNVETELGKFNKQIAQNIITTISTNAKSSMFRLFSILFSFNNSASGQYVNIGNIYSVDSSASFVFNTFNKMKYNFYRIQDLPVQITSTQAELQKIFKSVSQLITQNNLVDNVQISLRRTSQMLSMFLNADDTEFYGKRISQPLTVSASSIRTAFISKINLVGITFTTLTDTIESTLRNQYIVEIQESIHTFLSQTRILDIQRTISDVINAILGLFFPSTGGTGDTGGTGGGGGGTTGGTNQTVLAMALIKPEKDPNQYSDLTRAILYSRIHNLTLLNGMNASEYTDGVELQTLSEQLLANDGIPMSADILKLWLNQYFDKKYQAIIVTLADFTKYSLTSSEAVYGDSFIIMPSTVDAYSFVSLCNDLDTGKNWKVSITASKTINSCLTSKGEFVCNITSPTTAEITYTYYYKDLNIVYQNIEGQVLFTSYKNETTPLDIKYLRVVNTCAKVNVGGIKVRVILLGIIGFLIFLAIIIFIIIKIKRRSKNKKVKKSHGIHTIIRRD